MVFSKHVGEFVKFQQKNKKEVLEDVFHKREKNQCNAMTICPNSCYGYSKEKDKIKGNGKRCNHT
jgi:hypothetical protein